MLPIHTFLGLTAWTLQCALPFFGVLNVALNPEDLNTPKIWIVPLALFSSLFWYTVQYRGEYLEDLIEAAHFPLVFVVRAISKVIWAIYIISSIPSVCVLLWLSLRNDFDEYDSFAQRFLVYVPIGLFYQLS